MEQAVDQAISSGASGGNRAGTLALACLFGAIALCYAFPQHSWRSYRNVNESTRLYLVENAVENQALDIDEGIRRHGDLQDKAVFNGKFYCDKPVGLSVAGIAAYWPMRALGGLWGRVWTLQEMRYALSMVCVALPSIAMTAGMMVYWRRQGVGWRLAAFSALVYAVGSIACTYSTQFMGHQLAAALGMTHFVISRDFSRHTPWWKLLAAGGLAGFGAMTDYFSAFMHIIIGLSYLTRVRPAWRLGIVFVGAIVAFSPLLIYNAIAFRSPFSMAYAHQATPEFQKLHGTGFLGVTYPRLESFVGLLFSLRKGLFTLSPFFLLAPLGVIAGLRNPAQRRDAPVCVAVVAVNFWCAMSVHDWLGGWTVGPRHMVSALPFLMTLVVLGVSAQRRAQPLFIVFGLVGVAFNLATTLVFPAFNVDFANPIVDQTLFLLRLGFVSPNAARALGMEGAWTLLIPAAGVCAALAAIALGRGGLGRLDLASACIAAGIGAAFTGVVLLDRAQPEGIVAFTQGAVLTLADRPGEAAERLEKAVDEMPTPLMLSRAGPELMKLYLQRQDRAAIRRLRERWLLIDPSAARNPSLRDGP